ncbi:MAG: Mini-ribonuclease 3 [Floccifex sp.]
MEIVSENATSLAWMGDAIMSLKVREHLLSKGYQKANLLQKKSSRYCSAKGQARILDTLLLQNYFNEDEMTILNRGRNATIHSKAKNADGQTYLKATALEALLGYLYLYQHLDRLNQCLEKIIEIGENL